MSAATALGPAALAAHWVHIERENDRDALVGPYATKADANHAMEHALLIDSLCEADAVEVWLRHSIPAADAATLDVHVIDPSDSHHTGCYLLDGFPMVTNGHEAVTVPGKGWVCDTCEWEDPQRANDPSGVRRHHEHHVTEKCDACGGPIHNPTWGCTNPRTA